MPYRGGNYAEKQENRGAQGADAWYFGKHGYAGG